MTTRTPIGTYPIAKAKSLAKRLKKHSPMGITYWLRGRGPRRHEGRNWAQSLPLKYATHATIYVIDNRANVPTLIRKRQESARRADIRFMKYRITQQQGILDRLNAIERRPIVLQETRGALRPAVEAVSPLNAWERCNNVENIP